MPHAELHRDLALGRRQHALGCSDPSVGNDDRSVVQRRILEKDVLDQRPRNQRVDLLALLNDRKQIDGTRDNDQRTGFRTGHIGAGLDDRFDPLLPHDVHAPAPGTEYPAHERVPAIGVLRAEQQQKTPNLLLENDDQRNDPDSDHLTEYHAQQFHLESPHNDPQQIDDQNARHDAQRVGAARQPVNLKHQQRDDKNVDHVDQRHI